MTKEELAELFLVHLYDLAEAAPHPNFLFTVNDFAPQYGVADAMELRAALDYLGDRGLIILATIDMNAGVSAGITMDGSIFVEKGGETGIIAKFRQNPLHFIANGHSPEIPAEPVEARQPAALPGIEPELKDIYPSRAIDALLLDIEDFLEKDRSVNPEMRKDLTSDVATLKIQVSRNIKNRAVIRALLDNLSAVPSIAPLVMGLNCIVDAYFE